MSNHSLYSVKDCTVFNQWAKCSSHRVFVDLQVRRKRMKKAVLSHFDRP